jgi:hypothetical protein
VSRSALLYATTAAADGGPAALVGPREHAPLRRLLAQLAALHVQRAWIVVRPGWTEALQAAADGAPLRVTVLPSGDRCEDLRLTARVADEADGDLLLCPAEAMTHREALAGLVADPRIPSGGLTTSSIETARRALRVRAAGARIIAAASAYHRVGRPNGYFLGVLKVGTRDRAAAAAVARRLAELLDDPPAGWREAPEQRTDEWRRVLADAAVADRADRAKRMPGVLGWIGDADVDDELAARGAIIA